MDEDGGENKSQIEPSGATDTRARVPGRVADARDGLFPTRPSVFFFALLEGGKEGGVLSV